MIIAAVGDVHGLMRTMVRTLRSWERAYRCTIDLVVQVGDFEPHRHEADLRTMAAPSKHKSLGDFHEILDGTLRLPWPVVFIGGNHEPHGWLEHHPEGIEVAPNCTYLGRVGRIESCGRSIAGLSGIYDPGSFETPRPPVEAIGSVSNKEFIWFKEFEVEFALDLERPDILLSHDWPTGIVDASAMAKLMRVSKRAARGNPGNPWARMLLDHLQPRLMFCGHLHARHTARIEHASGQVTDVVCLGHMRTHEKALAVFSWEGDEVTRLDA